MLKISTYELIIILPIQNFTEHNIWSVVIATLGWVHLSSPLGWVHISSSLPSVSAITAPFSDLVQQRPLVNPSSLGTQLSVGKGLGTQQPMSKGQKKKFKKKLKKQVTTGNILGEALWVWSLFRFHAQLKCKA